MSAVLSKEDELDSERQIFDDGRYTWLGIQGTINEVEWRIQSIGIKQSLGGNWEFEQERGRLLLRFICATKPLPSPSGVQ